MRKVVDPSWECGFGFGSVKRKRTDLALPWEDPVFSFVAQETSFLDELQEQLLEATNSLSLCVSLPQPKLRSVAQWRPQDSKTERQAALSKWSQLLRAVPHFFPKETQLEVVHEQSQVELGNLDLRFAKKSTNTLLSRVSSLQRFAAWKVKCFPHEPLSESIVFLYCQYLSQKQPDSSALDQLCQALNFADGVLGLQTEARLLITEQSVQNDVSLCFKLLSRGSSGF